MRTVYIILAASGWVWAALVGLFLLVRTRRKDSVARGFEIKCTEAVETNEQ